MRRGTDSASGHERIGSEQHGSPLGFYGSQKLPSTPKSSISFGNSEDSFRYRENSLSSLIADMSSGVDFGGNPNIDDETYSDDENPNLATPLSGNSRSRKKSAFFRMRK